jgi:hypothetical protein
MIGKFAPVGLFMLGLLVMLGAFLYGAANALPYPDPTAEMLAYQAARADKANAILMIGFFATAAGGTWIWIRSRSRRRSHKLPS